MNLRGILVEYFITGGFALLWIFIILKNTGIYSELKELDNKIILGVFVISSIYMIGIVVDFIGKKFTEGIRHILVKGFNCKKIEKDAKFSVAEVYFKSNELGKQYEMRSSRDRIARGSIINIFILTIIVLISLPDESKYYLYVLFVGISLFSLSILIWIRFQQRSIQFLKDCKLLIRQSENK
jgi:hypothetical protein